MSDTIKIRCSVRCMVDARRIADEGEVVEFADPVAAAGMLADGRHELLNPEQAKRIVDAWNLRAYRAGLASLPRTSATPFALVGRNRN